MARFIVRRVVRGIVALLLFQSLLFALIHSLPYDFSAFMLARPDFRAFIRRQFGLDLPLWQQYLHWLRGFVRLDFGTSYLFWPSPVSAVLLSRIARTLLLFLVAAVVAYALGIWLGKVVAWHRGSWLEVGLTLGSVAMYTSFAPWLGFVMINIFGWYLGWLPYQRLVDPNVWFNAPLMIEELLARMLLTVVLVAAVGALLFHLTRRIGPLRRRLWRGGVMAAVAALTWLGWAASGLGRLAVDVLAHLALPLSTVVMLSFGETMLTMRTAMLETLNEDYVLMARAKGLPERVVRDRHAARNAILPVLTRLALNLPFVLVGSLVIERVFLWHAMGQLVFAAIEWQDIPMLLGILSLVGMLALAAHVVLDLLYFFLDPRVRYGAEV